MSEIQLQAKIFQYTWNEYPATRGLFFHVPNEVSNDHAFIFSYIEKIIGTPKWLIALKKDVSERLKRYLHRRKLSEGVVTGIPDMVLTYKGLTYGFELKTQEGVVSTEQSKIHKTWTVNCQQKVDS